MEPSNVHTSFGRRYGFLEINH